MKFFALSLLVIACNASAKINFSAGVVRGEVLNSGSRMSLDLNQRELCYSDETAYIEAEMVEETAENVVIQFTVATKNETGTFMVRGLPKLAFPINQESKISNGSLRCDGPTETFTLVVTVEKLEEVSEVAPVAQSAE